MTKAMACDVGRRITLSETVTGFSAIDTAVGTYDLTIESGKVTCKLGSLERSAVWNDIGTWNDTPPAGGNAAYDTVTNYSSNGSTGTSFSTTHTPIGTPKAIVVGVVLLSDPGHALAATYGGVTMNYAGYYGKGTNVYVFYLLAPPAGAQTVAVNWTGGNSVKYKMSCVSITGVTSFCAINGNDSGSGTTASVTDNCKSNGIMVGFMNTSAVDSPTASDTQVCADKDEDPALYTAYTLNTADGTDTIGWTNASPTWTENVVSFYTA